MNFFAKLIGRRPSNVTASAPAEPNPVVPVEPSLPRELFVNEEAPKPKSVTGLEESKSLYEQFMGRPYESMGYNDGNLYHNMDICEQQIKVLRVEFIGLVEQIIDRMKMEMYDLYKQQIESEGLSERLDRQLALHIKHLEEHIEHWELQKQLSVEGEGKFMEVAHKYKMGFIRGTEDYVEQKMLSGSKGIFR